MADNRETLEEMFAKMDRAPLRLAPEPDATIMRALFGPTQEEVTAEWSASLLVQGANVTPSRSRTA